MEVDHFFSALLVTLIVILVLIGVSLSGLFMEKHSNQEDFLDEIFSNNGRA